MTTDAQGRYVYVPADVDWEDGAPEPSDKHSNEPETDGLTSLAIARLRRWAASLCPPATIEWRDGAWCFVDEAGRVEPLQDHKLIDWEISGIRRDHRESAC